MKAFQPYFNAALLVVGYLVLVAAAWVVDLAMRVIE